jgi:RNA polymerase sigma-70 factor (ECF subfamily)
VSPDQFKQTLLPLHPKLFRVAYALTGNKDDAEDILQEAYCKLWNKREELTNIINPEAFSVTLIKNLCMDFLHTSKSGRNEDSLDTITIAIYNTPDTVLENADEVERVTQLIEQLPVNQKRVLKLRGFVDCSMEEIEEITGFSAVNVRTLLSRARKIIKEQYIKLNVYER